MSRLPPEFVSTPIAHRGLHDRETGVIENSLSAIEAAIRGGFGVEIDVQASADGVPLVFHDYNLKRLAEKGDFLRECDAQTLTKVVLSGSSDRIPTLTEVLDLVAGQVPLLVEVKDQDLRLGPNVGPLEREVGKQLRAYDGPLAMMSFNPHAVGVLAQIAPDVPHGLVTETFTAEDWPTIPAATRDRLGSIPDAENLGVDFISHNKDHLDSPAVKRLKALGLPVLCWTVRSAEEESAARRIADNITFEGYRPGS